MDAKRHLLVVHVMHHNKVLFLFPKARYNIEKQYSVIGLKQNIPHSFVLLEHFLPRFFNGAGEFYQRSVIKTQDPLLTTQKMSTFDEFQELLMNIDVKTISNPVIINEYELYQFIVQRYHAQIRFLGRLFAV